MPRVHRKHTTIRPKAGVTAESVYAQLAGFEWLGGPYRSELVGDGWTLQVWASGKAEADRVLAKLAAVCGYSLGDLASAAKSEGLVEEGRFQVERRYRVAVVDGVALISDRSGPAGLPDYPVVF
jgi:hypothetical protein